MNQPAARPGTHPSTRDRLLLAFSDLTRYGIVAQPALGTDPDTTRKTLRAAILAHYPCATASYIFWTASDERCFDSDGALRGPLTLHHSGADVARAAHAALGRVGLDAEDVAAPTALCVAANR